MTSSVPGFVVPETTRRCPATSSAQSRRPPPVERLRTSPCTRGSVASRPRADHRATLSQLASSGPGGVDGASDPRCGSGRRAPLAPQHPPPGRTGGEGGGTPGDQRPAAHRPAALLDEGRGVGRVALAGQQVLDGGVEVDVERPVGGLEAFGGPRTVVGGREPGAQRGVAVAHDGDRHPEQVGDLVGPGAPDRAGPDQGPLERRRTPHDCLESGAHRVVVIGVRPRVVSRPGIRPGCRGTGGFGGRSRWSGCGRSGSGARGRGGDRVAQHRPTGRCPGPALVDGLSPVLVQRGEGLRRDPAGRRGIEGDEERDALEVGPARGHELPEVVLDGEGHRSSLTPAAVGWAGLLRVGERREPLSAGRRRRPRRPRGCARWPGRTRPSRAR